MSGKDLSQIAGEWITFSVERSGNDVLLTGMDVHPGAYLKPGSAHLVADVQRMMRELMQTGPDRILARPDRSAMRLTLEIAGFRGSDDMRYAPGTAPPIPVLDQGRRGGFGLDTLIVLQDGSRMRAGDLRPGEKLRHGGRLEEVMRARARTWCRYGQGVFSTLNLVVDKGRLHPISDMEGVEKKSDMDGIEMVWLVTAGSRIESEGLLMTDQWINQRDRNSRNISEAEVLAALNRSEGFTQ